jgi:NAD(P)-dependent dehydrogenase (short-subunit alcohol dehydrogenase family)
MASDTIVWITGGTGAMGNALAKLCPYPGARIINLSRRKHPDFESVIFDIAEPSTWDNVRRHLEKELGSFKGKRAIFIQGAYLTGAHGMLESVDPDLYSKAAVANVAGPIAIGAMFVRACKPGYESGLVMLSSGAGAACLEGLSTYGPGKRALEHWSQIIDKELGNKPGRPWIVALRVGGVLTPEVQKLIDSLPENMPNAAHIRANAHRRLKPDAAAQEIWKVLPPPPGISLITFGPVPDYPGIHLEGDRMKVVDVPGWQVVYR